MTRKKHTRTRPETPAEWAERTRREQGLPAMITDPAVLERIGVLMQLTDLGRTGLLICG